jgi:predicted Rdx family selenoprotein
MDLNEIKQEAAEVLTNEVIVGGKIKKIIDETVLSITLLVCSSFWLLRTLSLGQTDMQIFAFTIFKASLVMTLGTLFNKFLNGLGFNVTGSIFKDGNIAAACYAGLVWVGLSIAVAFGNLS